MNIKVKLSKLKTIPGKVTKTPKKVNNKVNNNQKILYYSEDTGSPKDFCLYWAADSLKIYFPAKYLNGLSIFPPS
jgi:hypothetical protein